ncbi:XRE family transcriptional regulator [Bacteroides salyersiae]|uniref:XRE family transcriptional regulator n=1 Tax=Bacteroides salyersiae TaxID=291644 RepID=UPI001F02D80D|nr:XRE family transcriptional regulator [Bacteroides salyersiae]
MSRIRTIISHYQMTDRAFAIKCGIKQNTFSNQLNGARELSLATINAILISFEDISSEWLLRGKGEMLLSAIKPDSNIERMERLVDTIATLQGTINEQTKTIQLLADENRKVKGELAMLKNERNAG